MFLKLMFMSDTKLFRLQLFRFRLTRLLLPCLCLMLFPCRAGCAPFDLKRDFAMLDTVVANVDKYMSDRQKAIEASVSKGPFASDIERYSYYRHMFEEYKKFSSDSAMVYALRCKQTAVRAGMKEESMLADLDLLYITTLQGNFFMADSLARSIPPIDNFPPDLHERYAVVMIQYEIRVKMFVSDYGKGNIFEKINTVDIPGIWLKYKSYLPADSWLVDYYEGMCTNADMRSRIIRRMKNVPQPSAQAAMLYYILAKSCILYGTEDEACHYFILSAANDIMSANREASSLITLLCTKYIDRNSQRAVNYALASIKMAKGYKDKARSYDIVDASSIIISDYMNMQSRMGKNVVIIIVLLVVLVAMSAVLVYVFMRRSGRRKAELDLAMGYNSTLRESLEEITVTKEQMENVLTRRNAMALESFLMMSDYINGVDKFCKTTANMIVAGQSCKAHKALQEGCSAQFLASMYASFDRWFMSVHPDFIERFTALLRPEERGKFVPDAAVSSFCRIRKAGACRLRRLFRRLATKSSKATCVEPQPPSLCSRVSGIFCNQFIKKTRKPSAVQNNFITLSSVNIAVIVCFLCL